MLWRSCLLGVIAAVIVLRAGAAPAETIRRPTTGFGIQSVATVFDGPTTVYPNAVAVAPDRSVVVAASRGDAHAVLLRLSPGGRQIDFGVDHHPVRFETGVECDPALALRPDGSMVLACGPVVASVRPNGSIGWVTTLTGANLDAVVLDELGRTLAAGNVLVRIGSDGSIDPTFSGVTLPSPAASVTVDGGRILVVAGGSIVGYDEAGTPDRSFGRDGVASFTGFSAESLDQLSNGSILAGGSRGDQAAVVRFLVGGTVDTTFGSAGIAAWGPGKASTLAVNALATRANGAVDAAVLATGPIDSYATPQEWLVQRLTPPGALGATADGPNDFFTPPDGGCFETVPTAIAEQPNGMAVVAGDACQDNIDGDVSSLVMRYTSRLQADAGEALRVSATGRPVVNAYGVTLPVVVDGPCRLIARLRQVHGGTQVGRALSTSVLDVAGGRVLIRLRLSPLQLRPQVGYVVAVGAYDARGYSTHILVRLRR